MSCSYCNEKIIKRFMEEHYSECIQKIYQDQDKSNIIITKVECSICLLNIEEHQSKLYLQCAHLFHRGCIEEWFQKN